MPITGTDQALMKAQSNVARCGATRSGYHSALAFIKIGGTHRRANVLFDSLRINDLLDERPNTCSFVVAGIVPTKGQEVVITLGSENSLDRLFAGHILSVKQFYVGTNTLTRYQVDCVDYTYLLSRKKVLTRYTSQSASTIAASLISSFAAGFTSVNVESGLATVDEITFTNEDLPDALTRLAKRVGAYWYVDYHKDLHFWTGQESGVTEPVDLTEDHVSLSDFQYDVDMSQQITRVTVEGQGSATLVPRIAGNTTIPVQDASPFPSSGAVASGPQRITYSSKQAGGTGSVTGGIDVSIAAPTTTLNDIEGNINYQFTRYLVTHVINDAESGRGSLSSVLDASPQEPLTAPTLTGQATSGSLDALATYKVRVVYVIGGGLTEVGPEASVTLVGAQNNIVCTNVPVSPNAGCTARRVYRTEGGGSVFKLDETISDNVTTSVNLNRADGSLGADAPATHSPGGGVQVALTNIPLGPTGTSARRVYRNSAADSSNYRLVGVISDNTTTVLTDNVGDADLGEIAPLSSAVATVAGSTALKVDDLSQFLAGGGWVGVGGQYVSYTGRSAASGVGTLTGIPASGTGAIITDIPAGSPVTTTPHLVGVPASGTGAILFSLPAGEQVNLLATADDATAQSDLATLIGGDDDGIIEEYIQDGRLSYTEALARAEALLELRSEAEASIRYRSRDTQTRSGRTITVDLASPTSVSDAFKIQQVTISNFTMNTSVFPTYTASASSTMFTLEDLLRLSRKSSRDN